MRIIAGKYRRRKLLTNPGLTTRPLTDRIKEILFERLTSHFEGRRVADVFAGTGTIGLEALSRGARSVVFIEQDRRAWDLLVQNVEKLGVRDETLCWQADVLRTSFRPKGVPDLLPYDVVFFDPPYRMVEHVRPGQPLYKSLERLARDGVTSDSALLVFRTPERAEFEMPPQWAADRTWEFSSMEVHLFRKTKAAEPAADEPSPEPDSRGADF